MNFHRVSTQSSKF